MTPFICVNTSKQVGEPASITATPHHQPLAWQPAKTEGLRGRNRTLGQGADDHCGRCIGRQPETLCSVRQQLCCGDSRLPLCVDALHCLALDDVLVLLDQVARQPRLERRGRNHGAGVLPFPGDRPRLLCLKAEASRQVGSITRLGYASGALARVAGDLWQGKGESIDQPASPGLR